MTRLLALLAVLLLPACVSAPPADGPPRIVKIATQSPLTGEQAPQGEAIMLGARVALDDYRAALRARGFAVELVAVDDKADLDVAVAGAHRLVADPAILGVVGPLNSDVALSVAPVFAAATLAMISPSSTHAALTGVDHANVFRVCGRDDVQGDLGARFARDSLGAASVWIAHDGSTYGRDVTRFFEAGVRRRGVRVLGYDGVGDDISPALVAAIKAAAPDVVYFGGYDERAAALFKALRAAGVGAAFLGSDGLDSSDLARRAGDAVVDLYYTSVAGPVAVHPQAKAFAWAFKRRFGKKPEPFAAQAYDATAVLLEAVAAAARTGEVTRARVVQALRATRYLGYTGIVTFDAHGDLRQALYLVMKVGSADPDDWDDNRELKRVAIPPPPR